MRPLLCTIALLVACTTLSPAESHPASDYKLGTMISWGAGGENCSGLSVGKTVALGSVNCNPGGDTLYRISSDGHEFTLTRGSDDEGMLHSTADPLRKLLPKDEFKYRIDKKRKFFFVLSSNDDGKSKETKYTIRGVQ